MTHRVSLAAIAGVLEYSHARALRHFRGAVTRSIVHHYYFSELPLASFEKELDRLQCQG